MQGIDASRPSRISPYKMLKASLFITLLHTKKTFNSILADFFFTICATRGMMHENVTV
jgi:hypothetical protein